jgi:MFS family permease
MTTTTATTTTSIKAAHIPQDFRRVIVAASVGNVIEWYDFYIFGSLATVLAAKFFEKTHPVAALLSTIALFTAGFLIRPLGAFLFGWLGDRVGRKYTFLITLSGMGIGTGVIGLIPTFDQIGLGAAFALFGLRMIQGLCLGGEYGGAITYVAEHVSDERRGYYTGWLQTSPTLGIVVALGVVLATRGYFGEQSFNAAWGAWRVPFLVSFLLVAIAIYIRLQLGETPIFQEIKDKGLMTRNPWKEAFLSSNIKYVVVASIVVIGEGVVWYSGQFWALYFLQQVSKVDLFTSSYIVMIALLFGSLTLIFYGWLSDLIGRKPVILGGFLLAAVTYYPLYLWLGSVTQPGNINYPVAIFIIFILVSYVGMVYGPIGAFLAEYFPGRIRYTSVSVPYHIGNGWGGGLVPFITSAAFLATGSVFAALIYPIVVPIVCFVLGFLLMPETRLNSIWQPAATAYPAMSKMANVIGGTVPFVVLFVILMLLTYAPLYPLPPASGSAAAIQGYVVTAVQLAAWALLIGITFAHGIMIERGRVVVLPLLAAFANLLLPLLASWLGLVPETHKVSWYVIATILNIACIVMVVKTDQRRQAAAAT